MPYAPTPAQLLLYSPLCVRQRCRSGPVHPLSCDWRAAGLQYYHYNFFLRQKFGARVQKVSIDAGFTCPNVDGTVARGGCTFCDNRSFSPSRRLPRQGVLGQIDEGIRRSKWRYDVDRFLAYFQPATNTYAPVERLRPLYEAAISHPKVVGLAIGTRPDCVPNDVLDLLADIAGRTYLSVEYGMQTIHDRSLDWMNRGHHYDAFLDAMERSRGGALRSACTSCLGCRESRTTTCWRRRELARLGVDAVKIHNLYAVKDTPLAEQVARGEVELMEPRRVHHNACRLFGAASAEHVDRTDQRRGAAELFRGTGMVPRQAGDSCGAERGVCAAGNVAGEAVGRMIRRRGEGELCEATSIGSFYVDCSSPCQSKRSAPCILRPPPTTTKRVTRRAGLDCKKLSIVRWTSWTRSAIRGSITA